MTTAGRASLKTSPVLALRYDDGSCEAYDLGNLVPAEQAAVSFATDNTCFVAQCQPLAPQPLMQPAFSTSKIFAVATPMGSNLVPFRGLRRLDREPSNLSTTSSSCPSGRSASGSDDEVDEVAAASPGAPQLKRRRVQTKIAWTREEDAAIDQGVRKFGCKWARIAETLPVGRTDDAVRNRWHRLQRKQQKKARRAQANSDQDGAIFPPLVADGPDGPSSDTATIVLEKKHAESLPASSGLPEDTDKHGDMWTEEEDRIIDYAVRFQGLRWKAVAAMLPGRTDSGCRNRWVRNQQRILSSMGMPAKGAADIFAALRGRDAPATSMKPVITTCTYAQPIASW
eukprot:scaffold143022_cov28-Tisochrysis_lutea.AAC.2